MKPLITFISFLITTFAHGNGFFAPKSASAGLGVSLKNNENYHLLAEFHTAKNIVVSGGFYKNRYTMNALPSSINGYPVGDYPNYKHSILGLAAGYALNSKKQVLKISAVAGPAVMFIEKVTDVTPVFDPCYGPCFIGDSHYDYSWNIEKSTVPVLNARLDIHINVTRWIGLTAGTFINTAKSYTDKGITVGVRAGWLRNNIKQK